MAIGTQSLVNNKVRDRLDAKRKAETARIEERKNVHIERLMKAHEKAFAEIKNYYNDITHNNLDLIRSLKEEASPSFCVLTWQRMYFLVPCYSILLVSTNL